jgi:signal transduction histidine kinase
MTEQSTVSAEVLWQLACRIQREALHLDEADALQTVEFVHYLRQHDFLATLLSIEGPPTTLTLAGSSAHNAEPGAAVELLQRAAAVFEGDFDRQESNGLLTNPACQAVRQAIHDYLRLAVHRQVSADAEQQKLAQAMYNFAYGLSHEINNPLGSIAARASQLRKTVTDSGPCRSLQAIEEAAMRAHEMLAEMMLAVQRPSLSLERGDARPWLAKACVAWSKLAAEHQIQWQSRLEEGFLWCQFDRVSLLEAVSVGVRNSLDACRVGDRICFLAEKVESERGGLEVRLAVQDNGPGLSPESLDQAWDLFYCGREAGRGLGIGLAKTRRIIEAHGGRVWLESKDRAGCSLEIRLPWKRST